MSYNMHSGTTINTGLTIGSAIPSSISITGGGGYNPFNNITLHGNDTISLFGEPHNRNVKKYEVLETTEDLLVLSAVWYRLRKTAENYLPRPSSLTDTMLFDRITLQDRDLAMSIRDYYSKKLMMMTLRDQKLTMFRKDLNSFIHSDGKLFKETVMPLVYRLPEFHEYDIEFDVMANELTKQFTEPTTDKKITKQRLTPIKKLVVKHKTAKFNEYWLKDSHDRMYKLDIPMDNKLAHLWNHFFEQTSIPLKGYFKYCARDNINYYHVKNWELDFSVL